MTEGDLTPFVDRLRSHLPDDHSCRVLDGSWRAFSDVDNPLRLTFFSVGVRELIGHLFHLLAPDDEVRACDWFVEEHTTVTRQQRAKYMIQGGLPDAFLHSIDMAALYASVRPRIDELSKYVHIREDTAAVDKAVIQSVAMDTLAFLISLFDAIGECRKKVTDALEGIIQEETVMAMVTENLDHIDALSSTHSVDTVDVLSIEITGMDHEVVRFRIRGEIGVDFHWGPSDDGVDGDEAFSFEMTMWSFVGDLLRFEDIEITVDDSEWQEGFYGDQDWEERPHSGESTQPNS